MDFKQIKELISIVNDTKIGEIKIVDKDFKVVIRHRDYHSRVTVGNAPAAAMPAPPVEAPAPTAEKAAEIAKAAKDKKAADEAAETEHLVTVKSPMIGTFYRASSPDKPPYVKVGDHIGKEDVLCIIEAMKLFNEIESEVSGKIVKVLVENQSPVEYDQPLFLIDPNG